MSESCCSCTAPALPGLKDDASVLSFASPAKIAAT